GLRVGKLASEVHENVDETIADLEEIVRLPVVAHSRREERIENRLPGGERLRSDHVRNRPAELAQRLEHALASGDVARIARREHQNLLAMPLRWQEGKR